MKLIKCEAPEQVYRRVREWTSELTDDEHLVRSTILDVHASLEGRLKYVLYDLLVGAMFRDLDEEDESYEKKRDKLRRTVDKMNFAAVHRQLKPLLEAFPSGELANIPIVNELRNQVVHGGDTKCVQYKGRSPFTDADCLAQLYFDVWAARSELAKFLERQVDDPRALLEHYKREERAQSA
jgi:hypothetical protein